MSRVQLQMSIGPAGCLADEDERQLVQRAKSDREAFAVLYRRHHRPLLDYVFRRTGDRHATEDLVADVFLTVLRTLARYRYHGVPLRFWLLRIATNAVNRWARRRRRARVTSLTLAELEGVQKVPASTGGEIDVERAQRALLALPPKFQSVLALYYLEGLSVTEVATIVGCRAGTVKSRLARARDALRDEITYWR